MVRQEPAPALGRPRSKHPKRNTVHVRVEDEIQQGLDAYADRRGIERPQAVRELLRVALGLEKPR